MKRVDYIICFLLGVAALVSRIPFLEKFQSFWDGPQYTIGIVRYSFDQQTPAAPGYPLFIGLGKFFHIFIQDPHTSLLAVTVLASITSAITLYMVGLKMFNRFVGLAATVIFLTGSTFYFFSIAPHAYDLLATIVPLLAYSVYRVFIQKKQDGLFLGFITGLLVALRPQEIILVGPLFLLGFLALTTQEKVKTSIAFILVSLSWFVPVVLAVSFTGYFTESIAIAKMSVSSGSILQHLDTMIKGFLLSFGVAPLFLIFFASKHKQIKKMLAKQDKILIFYSAWILPGFLYNFLLRSDAVGYQFSYLIAILFFISYAIWQSTKKKKFLYFTSLICIALFNLFWFFYDRDPTFTKPYRTVSYHYSEVRKNDIKFGGKVTFIQRHFDPKTTLVIPSTDYWRQYMYYLKNYHIVSPSGLTTNESRFIHKEYYAYDWDMSEVNDKNISIAIPNYIKTVIFTDDDAHLWVADYPNKVYNLPGNSIITSIKISPGAYLRYNFHYIKIAHKQN
ncbi:MAG TPA: glycosyltransferase family 39 protein [Patescibacteria group bacterium]|nr:glycosyltransferase family 39 protein [Patescibacteria group bacterium]